MFTPQPRRYFLRRLALASACLTAPGAFAEQLQLTPSQTEGPFYPDHLPLDTDNDLLVLNDSTTPAIGEVTYLSGRILGMNGSPLRNATIEIWQCDAHGVYLHSGSDKGEARDRNFQGYGRFFTGSSGEYLFRTIKPVAYTGRCPHIHAKIHVPGEKTLTTQVYVEGSPLNEKDGVRRGIHDPRALASVTVPFTPLPGSRAGELAARWDIILGVTPDDPSHPS